MMLNGGVARYLPNCPSMARQRNVTIHAASLPCIETRKTRQTPQLKAGRSKASFSCCSYDGRPPIHWLPHRSDIAVSCRRRNCVKTQFNPAISSTPPFIPSAMIKGRGFSCIESSFFLGLTRNRSFVRAASTASLGCQGRHRPPGINRGRPRVGGSASSMPSGPEDKSQASTASLHTSTGRLSLISRHLTKQYPVNTPFSVERLPDSVDTSLLTPAQKRLLANMSSQPEHPAVLIPGPIEFDDAVLQSMGHFR